MPTPCFSLCRCSITHSTSLPSFQAFFEPHHTSFEPWRCQWFKQATEILQAQEASKQFAAEQARIATAIRLANEAQQQQQAEEARMTAFSCRRCNVRDRHAKKPTSATVLSKPLAATYTSANSFIEAFGSYLSIEAFGSYLSFEAFGSYLSFEAFRSLYTTCSSLSAYTYFNSFAFAIMTGQSRYEPASHFTVKTIHHRAGSLQHVQAFWQTAPPS